MDLTKNLWACEWNLKQGYPHVEILFDYIRDSSGRCRNREGQDWILVGVVDNQQEAMSFLSEFTKTMIDLEKSWSKYA